MPTIRGPKVLQDKWDKRKTVKQNYTALGLLNSLNPMASGGAEDHQETPVRYSAESSRQIGSTVLPVSDQPDIRPGFGRIVRDETGNVIGIEVNEEGHVVADEKDARLGVERLEPVVDPNVLSKWSMSVGTNAAVLKKTDGYVADVLEGLSAPQSGSTTLSFALSGAGPRYASAAEMLYLQRLVDKYGDNIDRMARDHKLNSDQRTPGQLRSALRRAGMYHRQ